MNTAAAESPDLAARRAAALSLLRQGHLAEAERAFSELLRDAPQDVDALNFLAIRAHADGRVDEALDLLTRALAAQPEDATTLTNLGALHRERGRIEEAVIAFGEAVRVSPRLAVARLRLAEALQAQGRTTQALPAYFGAIMAAQSKGRWLDQATTEPALRSLVMHAMRVVEGGRRALFAALLAPLRERHGGAALARVEKCLAGYLGDLQLSRTDPQQRPTFLYFPDLPTTRFFERDLFPWYAELEAHTVALREEMLVVLAEDGGFESFFGHSYDPRALQEQLRNDRGEAAWNAFFFYRHGTRQDQNAARCPRSIAALDAVPTLCRIREHAPEACFSLLTPGSHILPHRGVTNTRAVTHLPLVVPDGDLALHVSGELMRWQEGRCFTFDDTFEHEAWNRSEETRVVVLLDVWNPYLTDIEREAVTTLTAGIGDFNRAAGL
jgi:aspartate beta-hydroxylase